MSSELFWERRVLPRVHLLLPFVEKSRNYPTANLSGSCVLQVWKLVARAAWFSFFFSLLSSVSFLTAMDIVRTLVYIQELRGPWLRVVCLLHSFSFSFAAIADAVAFKEFDVLIGRLVCFHGEWRRNTAGYDCPLVCSSLSRIYFSTNVLPCKLCN